MNNDLFLVIDCSKGMCDVIATAKGVIQYAREGVDLWKESDDGSDADITRVINDCYIGLKSNTAFEQAKAILETDNFSTTLIPDNMKVCYSHETDLFSLVNNDYDCKENELLIDPKEFLENDNYKKIF